MADNDIMVMAVTIVSFSPRVLAVSWIGSVHGSREGAKPSSRGHFEETDGRRSARRRSAMWRLASLSAGPLRIFLYWDIVKAKKALEVLNPAGDDLPGVRAREDKAVTKVFQNMNVLLEHISP